MEEKHQEIIHQVNALFMRCGIKSVTMDDIARELKISKKTLYQFVTDKADLVCKTITQHCALEEKITSQILEQYENAIDELVGITMHVSEQLQQIHPSIHYDLEKYYPDAWKVFNDHKERHIFKCVSGNLTQGILQGLYRKNLNVPIIAKIYISRIDVLFDGAVFPPNEYSFKEVFYEMMRYHIRGIASEKGIAYLTEKIKKEKLSL